MLSHYRLVEEIDKGGMGVVWKAHDGKLDRDVAVKILPAEFSQDKQRLARFDREAKLLAALNHPNIASIHGLEHTDGVHFLVLELIPGQSLAEALKDGPLPVEEAIDVCRQVAEGLEAAHDAGVIHRDLKPGNVRVTPDGKAKVLDFGLAKGLEGVAAGSGTGGSASDLSQSPTIAAGTQAGVVLGTAPYMSPEQARGKKLDKRTDIWSFGCLLYECLTGRMAFTGETAPDIFSAILQSDPDWSALPDRTPPRVRELMERCLEKSPRNRLHDIGDARIEIEKSLAGREWTTSGIRAAGDVKVGPRRPSWATLAAAAVITLAIGSIITWIFKPGPISEPERPTRVSVVPPQDLRIGGFGFALSPDGETLLLTGSDRATPASEIEATLYKRRLDSFDVEAIRGSEGIGGSDGIYSLAFSPDGRWIAMGVPLTPGSAKWQLVKVPLDGSGPPAKIADWPDNAGDHLWLPGGDLIGLTYKPYEILRFPTDGRPPLPPVEVQVGKWGENWLFLLDIFPDDSYVLAGGDVYAEAGWRFDLLVLDVRTGHVRALVEDAYPGNWSPTGHLLFTRQNTLHAVPFDLDQLEVTGTPLALIDGLKPWFMDRYGAFDFARTGTLAYASADPGESGPHLAIVSRDGEVESWLEKPGQYAEMSVSRDGAHLAASSLNPATSLWEIWISEMANPRLRPLVSDPELHCWYPVWSPDGTWIAFRCVGPGNAGGVYIRHASGNGEPQLVFERRSPDEGVSPTSFTPDGSELVVIRWAEDNVETLLVPVVAGPEGTRETRVLLPREARADFPVLVSADGKWIAHTSDETGRDEVYVRSMSSDGDLGPKLPVSTEGGSLPVLAPGRDGASQELFYREGSVLMGVRVTSEPKLAVSESREILDLVNLRGRGPKPLPDGRFLFRQFSEEAQELKEIKVVLNFDEEIKRKFAEAE
jgi:serine/threonine-protein kinase